MTSSRDDGSDLAAFAAEHGLGLVRFAYMLCGDRWIAEDLVQIAYLGIFRRFGDRLPPSAPLAYARRAVINANTSRMRRSASREMVVDDVPDRPGGRDDLGERDLMWRHLAGLPERQRTVLVCRYYLDLSDAQIAGLLGAREGTVRSLAARGFGLLRTHPDFADRKAPR